MVLAVDLPVGVHLVAQDRVLAIRLDADLGAEKPVDRHRVGGAEPGEGGIRPLEGVAVGKRIGGGDRRVVEPDHLALRAEELARERADADPALGAHHEIEREPDEVGESPEDAVSLLRRHRGTPGEERGVVGGRELLGLADDLLERGPGGERARPTMVDRGVISSAGEMRIAPLSPIPVVSWSIRTSRPTR